MSVEEMLSPTVSHETEEADSAVVSLEELTVA